MAVLHHKCQPGLSPPPPRSRASALREGKKRNNNKNETKQNETPKKRNRKRVQWRCPVSRTGGAPGSPAAVHRAGVSVGLEPPSPGLHPAGPPCSEWCPPRRPSGPGGNGSPSRTPGRGPERSPPPSHPRHVLESDTQGPRHTVPHTGGAPGTHCQRGQLRRPPGPKLWGAKGSSGKCRGPSTGQSHSALACSRHSRGSGAPVLPGTVGTLGSLGARPEGQRDRTRRDAVAVEGTTRGTGGERPCRPASPRRAPPTTGRRGVPWAAAGRHQGAEA